MCVWGGETPWKRVTHASPLTPGTHERLLPNAHMGAQQPTGPPPPARPPPQYLLLLSLSRLLSSRSSARLASPGGKLARSK